MQEMSARRHPAAMIQAITYDNPLTFLKQSGKFDPNGAGRA